MVLTRCAEMRDADPKRLLKSAKKQAVWLFLPVESRRDVKWTLLKRRLSVPCPPPKSLSNIFQLKSPSYDLPSFWKRSDLITTKWTTVTQTRLRQERKHFTKWNETFFKTLHQVEIKTGGVWSESLDPRNPVAVPPKYFTQQWPKKSHTSILSLATGRSNRYEYVFTAILLNFHQVAASRTLKRNHFATRCYRKIAYRQQDCACLGF